MNINKMLCFLNQAKSMGLEEIDMFFDTNGRKFDYHMAEIGSFYLEPNWMEPDKKVIINLYEKNETPVRYPHDPRLEPGGIFEENGNERKSGWGFWNKDYTKWYGPWDDFRDAEKEMIKFDKESGT